MNHRGQKHTRLRRSMHRTTFLGVGVFYAWMAGVLPAQRAENRPVLQLPHTQPIGGIAVAGDLLLSGAGDHNVKVWNTANEVVRNFPVFGSVNCLAFVASTKQFAYCPSVSRAEENGRVELRDLQGRLQKTIPVADSYTAESLSVTPDGRHIAFGTYRSLNLWNAAANAVHRTDGGVKALAFDDEQRLYVAFADSVRGYRIEGGKLSTIRTYAAPETGVQPKYNALFVDPAGSVLAVAGSAGSRHFVRLWDRNGKLLHEINDYPANPYSLVLDPQMETVITGHRGGQILLRALDGRKPNRLSAGTETVSALAFFQGNLVAGDMDGNLYRYAWPSLEPEPNTVNENREELDPVRCVDATEDLRTVAWGSRNGQVTVWNPGTASVRKIDAHGEAVTRLRIAPDASLMATAAQNGEVKLWKLDGSLLRAVFTADGGVTDVAWSPDSARFATTGEDSAVRIFDRNGEPLHYVEPRPGVPLAAGRSLVFAPDGASVLVGRSPGIDRIGPAGEYIAGYGTYRIGNHIYEAHEFGVDGLTVARDGKTFVSAGEDKSIIVWDAQRGTMRKKIDFLWNSVTGVAHHPLRAEFVAVALDHCVRLWTYEGTERLLSCHENYANDLVLKGDGRFALSGGSDGIVQIARTDGRSTLYAANYFADELLVFDTSGRYDVIGEDEEFLTGLLRIERNGRLEPRAALATQRSAGLAQSFLSAK